MVRKKQTRKYGKIRKKKNYSLKRKKSSQFRKKRRQRRTKKIIGGWGNPRTRHYWDSDYSKEKKTCWKEKHSLSTTDYNTCKRDAYLNYLKRKLRIEVKEYAEKEINKIKTNNFNLHFNNHRSNIINNMNIFMNERQNHYASTHEDINREDITMTKTTCSDEAVNVTDIFNELTN